MTSGVDSILKKVDAEISEEAILAKTPSPLESNVDFSRGISDATLEELEKEEELLKARLLALQGKN